MLISELFSIYDRGRLFQVCVRIVSLIVSLPGLGDFDWWAEPPLEVFGFVRDLLPGALQSRVINVDALVVSLILLIVHTVSDHHAGIRRGRITSSERHKFLRVLFQSSEILAGECSFAIF